MGGGSWGSLWLLINCLPQAVSPTLICSKAQRESNKYNLFFLGGGSVLMRNNALIFKSVTFSQYLIRFTLHKYCTYCKLFLNKIVTGHFIGSINF